MKLLLMTFIVVYLIQAYRLATVVHRNAGVDVSLFTMFLRAADPTNPRPGFSGAMQNVLWLLTGKQERVVRDLIISKQESSGFSNSIEIINVIDEQILREIIIPIAIRNATSFAEVRSNMFRISNDAISKSPQTINGNEALNRIRRVAKDRKLATNDILDEMPRLLEYVRDTTITELSENTIRK